MRVYKYDHFNVIWGQKWLLGTEKNEFLEARGSFLGYVYVATLPPGVERLQEKNGYKKKGDWVQQKARKQVRLNQCSTQKLSTSPA